MTTKLSPEEMVKVLEKRIKDNKKSIKEGDDCEGFDECRVHCLNDCLDLAKSVVEYDKAWKENVVKEIEKMLYRRCQGEFFAKSMMDGVLNILSDSTKGGSEYQVKKVVGEEQCEPDALARSTRQKSEEKVVIEDACLLGDMEGMKRITKSSEEKEKEMV